MIFSLSFVVIAGLCLFNGANCLLYPRDSESRNSKSLDGVWNFRISDFEKPDEGFDENWFLEPLSQSGQVIPMPVPSSYNDITQMKSIRDFIGWAWYDTEFFAPSEWRTKRVVLRFGSVHYFAAVYLNGVMVTTHIGGHLPFEVEVDKFLSYKRTNRVTVAVNNTLTPETIPQGSVKYFNDTKRYPKDFYKYSGNFDFFNYAGIHRSVQLYTTPTVYISEADLTTSFNDTTGKIDFVIKHAKGSTLYNSVPPDATCQIILRDKNHKVVSTASSCQGSLIVNNVTLWWPYTMDPEPGYLYSMELRLNSSANIDVYYQKVGIRTVSTTEDEFLINNKPFYFTGFGKHEDANIRGKGLDLPILIKDFNLIKWIGANSIRTSHYPYSEELMDQADEQGIVIIDEAPAVGLRNFTATILQAHLEVIRELITRDNNRPSVVMWSVANEPHSAKPEAEKYFSEIVAFAKSLDGTRPISAALSGNIKTDKAAQFMDVIMRNRYYAWYSNMGYPEVIFPQIIDEFHLSRNLTKKPTMISEYGADTIAGFHTSPPVAFTEDYQTELMIEHHKAFDQLRKEGGFIGEHIWNFADFMTIQQTTRVVGNKKGIFTRERQPKASAKLLRCRYWQLANFTATDNEFYCPASSYSWN